MRAIKPKNFEEAVHLAAAQHIVAEQRIAKSDADAPPALGALWDTVSALCHCMYEIGANSIDPATELVTEIKKANDAYKAAFAAATGFYPVAFKVKTENSATYSSAYFKRNTEY